MTQEIQVPDLGMDGEVEVIELCVSEGDNVEIDAPIVVLESDKATMEVPCPNAGKVIALRVKVGDKVKTGSPLLQLEGSAAAAENQPKAKASEKKPSQPAENKDQAPKEQAQQASAKHDSKHKAVEADPETAQREPDAEVPAPAGHSMAPTQAGAEHAADEVHAGPAVRKMARELGVELARVSGTGPRQRILKEDLQAYIKAMVGQAQRGSYSAAALDYPALPDFTQFGEVSTEGIGKIQQLTARGMSQSWTLAPQVTQFDQADVTELEAFRQNEKARAEKHGIKLTLMPFLIKACAHALKSLPQFNVSLDMANSQLIRKHYINIGVAVDTPHGLFVPVLRDVDRKSIYELARELQDLAARATEKKLKPAELQGGCFSISSLGGIGGTAFTPIVNLPEVAILGVSKSQYQPVYQSGEFVPRLLLPLSLSYDHRAVNGADAARFTSLIAELLADARRMLL